MGLLSFHTQTHTQTTHFNSTAINSSLAGYHTFTADGEGNCGAVLRACDVTEESTLNQIYIV